MTDSLLSAPLSLVLTDSLPRYLEKIAFLSEPAERNKTLSLTNVLLLQVRGSTGIQYTCLCQICPNWEIYFVGKGKKRMGWRTTWSVTVGGYTYSWHYSPQKALLQGQRKLAWLRNANICSQQHIRQALYPAAFNSPAPMTKTSFITGAARSTKPG